MQGEFWPAAPHIGFGVNDVRIVAAAHCLAAFTPGASGRWVQKQEAVSLPKVLCGQWHTASNPGQPPIMNAGSLKHQDCEICQEMCFQTLCSAGIGSYQQGSCMSSLHIVCDVASASSSHPRYICVGHDAWFIDIISATAHAFPGRILSPVCHAPTPLIYLVSPLMRVPRNIVRCSVC